LKLQAQKRKKAYRWGHYAEFVAALWLIMKGYRILKRRYGAWGGEIDLVIARGNVIAFVEVKARSDFDSALEAIDRTKSRRLGKAIEDWIFHHQPPYGYDLRGDAVIIVPWRFPRHIEDAFELPLD
jgi:putative endonuclease